MIMAEEKMLVPSKSTGSNPYRWVVCALLFFATAIAYMDRQILSLVKSILDTRLHWTNEQFGWVNAAFQGSYALGYLSFGWFIDRLGTKIGYSVSIFVWSIGAIVHSFFSSIGGFVFSRIVLGVGEGGNFPCAIKTVALWFPKSERSLATGLFNSGANIGPMVAPIFIPLIAIRWGWQATFITVGIAGLVWLGAWILVYRAPLKDGAVGRDADAARSSVANPEQPKIPWRSLFGFRQTWALLLAKFLTDPVYWFLLIWLPDFFHKTRGMDIKQSGIYIFAIYTIVTVASIAGSWLPGYFIARGWSVTRSRKTAMFLLACCVVPVLFVTQVGLWPAIILIGLAGAAHQAWAAIVFTTVSDIFPKSAVASVTGIAGMAGAFGGMIFPVVTGRVLDFFAAKNAISNGYNLLFTFCAFAYLVAFAVNHLLAPSFENISREEAG